ncbi:hypothetical protein OQ252_12205 [Acetobacter farinalis]|uniref:Phage neck terminator protein gp12-like domain-containing protein n=1 Tax=Acetobacter farinalis TaxID=1260984 RepID=A0ABT3QA34_9PROT|nr:hypothetical protein [Acetobacter farinalis]MCX2562153.1 hypothetical protein [Acetobacter farinalis]
MVETSGNPAMPLGTPPITAALTTALRAFLQACLPSETPILLARQNRMAAPLGLFALMTILQHQRVATSASRYTGATRIVLQQQESTVQVSLFGPGAGEGAQLISALFNNGWAAEFFTAFYQTQNQQPPCPMPVAAEAPPPGYPTRIAPLHAGPARQIPFVNGERQYEEHWQIDLHLQASFSLTRPQQTAPVATLALAEVTSLQGFPFA